MTTVTHYGLHQTNDGVHYLHQGGGKSANFIGLAAPSPFEVRTSEGKQRACPHTINVGSPMPDREHWRAFMEIYPDELTKQFLPLPKLRGEPVPFIENVDDMLLLVLSKLSSPIYPVIHHIASYPIRLFEEQMRVTNVTPLVLTHIQTEHQTEIERLSAIAMRSPRKLILVGDRHMVICNPMQRIETQLEYMDHKILYTLPMEQLGAVALRRWARGEGIDSPWERYGT